MSYEIFGNNLTELHTEELKTPDTKSATSDKTSSSNDRLEGRNSVMEAIRAGRTIDKVYIQDGLRDNTISRIISKLKGTGTLISFVKKERLDSMSETGHHQGIIAQTTSYEYSSIEDIFELAKKKNEPPFIILLDEIVDPHNLGAIIRTANIAGAHGVIIPKHNATGLTATVVRASAGAINFTPVVKVTNISKTIEELKGRGLWFACADMGGDEMYKCNLTGAIGLVIGNEGTGVSRLVKEKCDYIVSIPMKGDIESLNASVATGILAYEIVRQRLNV
ncbi:MAG: 23S rRNA (guanosine(2251)-2'-O)-methyltransferase RlmB [Eubacterium sp.]|nr:23S rRNA (guanosine(2251)-2'-O)-methyltransferase RlmB [Eubacterium sp.]